MNTNGKLKSIVIESSSSISLYGYINDWLSKNYVNIIETKFSTISETPYRNSYIVLIFYYE